MLKSSLPLSRAVTVATLDQLAATEIRDVDFTLHDMFAATAKGAYTALISGKTIERCRIQGPGILLASTGTTFTDVNFGDPRGGMGNLLVRSLSDKVIGSIPFRDCAFISCEFYGVGFTGPEEFLEQMLKITNEPAQ
jgi:hypothetical protein